MIVLDDGIVLSDPGKAFGGTTCSASSVRSRSPDPTAIGWAVLTVPRGVSAAQPAQKVRLCSDWDCRSLKRRGDLVRPGLDGVPVAEIAGRESILHRWQHPYEPF
jgi:hypothetical protein